MRRWPIPIPTRKANQGSEPPWCAVLEWLQDGFRFQRPSARPSGRKLLVVATPLWPADRFLDWARVPDQRVLWVKWYISTRNTFCGHSGDDLSTSLSTPSGSTFLNISYFYSQVGGCLINQSEEVYGKTNYPGFSNNGGFVCMHLTVAKPIEP